MIEDIKISIVVPTYNNAPWLSRCLDSLLTQIHKNLEIIVVDDGSNDNTQDVLVKYSALDSRIHPIYQENGGVTSARLHGISEATGEWIGFVDGDDWVEPDMFLRLLENANTYGVEISHCGLQRNFPDGRVDFYYNSGRIVQQSNTTGLRDLLEGQFMEPGLVCKLFQRELLSGIEQKMDPNIRINEDLLMNYYLFEKAETAVFEDICPYHYVMHLGSAANSRLNLHKLEDPLRVTKILIDERNEAVQDVMVQKLVRQLISGATMLLRDQPELIRPFQKATRCALRCKLKEILTGQQCSPQLKIMALWAAAWPASYALVHEAYSWITGLNQKYNVES